MSASPNNKIIVTIIMVKKLIKNVIHRYSKFKLKSNQYIPYNAKRTPSGYPMASTYYYFVNEKNQTIDLKTLKPYRGKQKNRYAMYNEAQAIAYLEVINRGE